MMRTGNLSPRGCYSQPKSLQRSANLGDLADYRLRPRLTIRTHMNVRPAKGRGERERVSMAATAAMLQLRQPFQRRASTIRATAVIGCRRVANGYPEVCLVPLLVAAVDEVMSQDSDDGLVTEGAVKVERSEPRRGLTLTASVSAQWNEVWRSAGPWMPVAQDGGQYGGQDGRAIRAGLKPRWRSGMLTRGCLTRCTA